MTLHFGQNAGCPHTQVEEEDRDERGTERERGRERAKIDATGWVGRPAKCDDDDAIWRRLNVVTDSAFAALRAPSQLAPALLPSCLRCTPCPRPYLLPTPLCKCSKTTHLASGLTRCPLFMAEQVFPSENALAWFMPWQPQPQSQSQRNSQVTKRSNCIAPNWSGHQTENLC